jgi:hypothetical protein
MRTIQKIKDTFKIEPIAARYCGGLKPSGHSKRYLVGYCPDCQPVGKRARPPRFWVDTKLQICNCFKPSCKSPKPMDVINLYARLNGLDNDTAIADLWAERAIGMQS